MRWVVISPATLLLSSLFRSLALLHSRPYSLRPTWCYITRCEARLFAGDSDRVFQKRLKNRHRDGKGSNERDRTRKQRGKSNSVQTEIEEPPVDDRRIDDVEISSAVLNEEDAVDSAAAESETQSIREKMMAVMQRHLSSFEPALCLRDTKWYSDRLEVSLALAEEGPEGCSPSIDDIGRFHSTVYAEMELDPQLDAFFSNFEIIMASPGIDDVLTSDRDFVSFKGFPVTVTTSEIFKKKDMFEGSLMGRTDSDVSINVKGRIINIPRSIVTEVRLPPSQREDGDEEFSKLR